MSAVEVMGCPTVCRNAKCCEKMHRQSRDLDVASEQTLRLKGGQHITANVF